MENESKESQDDVVRRLKWDGKIRALVSMPGVVVDPAGLRNAAEALAAAIDLAPAGVPASLLRTLSDLKGLASLPAGRWLAEAEVFGRDLGATPLQRESDLQREVERLREVLSSENAKAVARLEESTRHLNAERRLNSEANEEIRRLRARLQMVSEVVELLTKDAP